MKMYIEEVDAQIIIPTRNAGENIYRLFESIEKQENVKFNVLVIDSASTDGTSEVAKRYGYKVKSIKQENFNHGGTRQLGVEMCGTAEFIIFLTQDVILADTYSIQNLLACFRDNKVGCAYGRQLPHKDTNALAMHARSFNYPDKSRIKGLEDIQELGIKTVFISNSFAAYRKKALKEVGGFPRNVILGEDTYVAAKMLKKNWKNFYCAEARVYHSHEYNLTQEFKRYFDIGTFYGREKWIKESFGKAEREGKKFFVSEIKYMFMEKEFFGIVMAFIHTIYKYVAYKRGLKYGYKSSGE